MADRLSERLRNSDSDSDSDSDSESMTRLEKTQQATIEMHQLDGGDRPRRLVVKREDGVYNLYLQSKEILDGVGRWKTVRLLVAGVASNPLQ